MPLTTLQPPDSVSLNLSTLTPLHTGGISQCGEQLHPSGLLGSIRHFSCLVARALEVGQKDEKDTFENRVWGLAGNENNTAKQIALRWDSRQLQPEQLPEAIRIEKNRGWYFNQALKGDLKLTITRCGISDADWQILLLALRIQIRHSSFGAKDQFGLGVLACEQLPVVEPLDVSVSTKRPKKTDSLWHTAFFKIQFKVPPKASFNTETALRKGLEIRYALRNALRGELDSQKELGWNSSEWQTLRHQMMGSLNEYGSAVDVSALYLVKNKVLANDIYESRITVQLKPEQPSRRTEIMKAFNNALKEFSDTHSTDYQWAGGISNKEGKEFRTLSAWINHLAGL